MKAEPGLWSYLVLGIVQDRPRPIVWVAGRSGSGAGRFWLCRRDWPQRAPRQTPSRVSRAAPEAWHLTAVRNAWGHTWVQAVALYAPLGGT